jgi:hypothetical protein
MIIKTKLTIKLSVYVKGLTHHDNACPNRNSSSIHDKKKKNINHKNALNAYPNDTNM